MKHPAIGLIELKSIARGVVVTDAMVKKSPVKILETHPMCPGKYMILIGGEVAEVEESMKAGIEAAGESLINDLILPQVDKSVIPAITGTTIVKEMESIGVVESFSIASCVVAADIAAKESNVELVEVRLAQGLGGKAYFVFTGKLTDVEQSLYAARKFVSSEGMLAGAEIIRNPHKDVINKAVYW
jgi:microcompartment protein CcmL/EutN